MKKNKGRKFEDECQKTINSGAFFRDADLKTSEFCIECKYTDKKGFRISNEILEKLWEQSFSVSKLPKLIIGITRNETEMFILNCDITIQRKK